MHRNDRDNRSQSYSVNNQKLDDPHWKDEIKRERQNLNRRYQIRKGVDKYSEEERGGEQEKMIRIPEKNKKHEETDEIERLRKECEYWKQMS